MAIRNILDLKKNQKSAKIRIPQRAHVIHFQTAIFLNRMSQTIQLKYLIRELNHSAHGTRI
jgi:hypothetical protein